MKVVIVMVRTMKHQIQFFVDHIVNINQQVCVLLQVQVVIMEKNHLYLVIKIIVYIMVYVK